MKTQFRKDMDSEIADKLLLKNASVWAILRHLIKRYRNQLGWGALVLVGFVGGVLA